MNATFTDLHLIDFANVAPNTLHDEVISAIDKANTFLDDMTAASETDHDADISAEQALMDVMAFDHINLALIAAGVFCRT